VQLGMTSGLGEKNGWSEAFAEATSTGGRATTGAQTHAIPWGTSTSTAPAFGGVLLNPGETLPGHL